MTVSCRVHCTVLYLAADYYTLGDVSTRKNYAYILRNALRYPKHPKYDRYLIQLYFSVMSIPINTV